MSGYQLRGSSEYDLANQERIDWLVSMSNKYNFIRLNGKVPIEKGWDVYSHQRKEFNVEDYLTNNAGIVTGPSSGLLVLDIDNPELFNKFASSNNFEVTSTFTVKTAKGEHRYYRYPAGKEIGCFPFKHPIITKVSIFDVRGKGGQVVAPYSIHPDTKAIYTISNDIEVAEAPEWLLLDKKDYNCDGLMYISPGEVYDSAYLKSLMPKIGEEYYKYVLNGAETGSRSELIAKVIMKLLSVKIDFEHIVYILLHFAIGEKAKEKGSNRLAWIKSEIQSCQANYKEYTIQNPRDDQDIIEKRLIVENPGLSNFKIPDNYYMSTSNGIVKLENYGRGKSKQIIEITACLTPVYVSALYVDVYSLTQSVELTFRECGKWSSVKVSREIIATANKIVSLSAHGLNVTSTTAKHLVEYLSLFLKINEDTLTRHSMTSSLGWDPTMSVFLLGNNLINNSSYSISLKFNDTDQGLLQIANGFNMNGSYQEWVHMVSLIKDFPLITSYLFGSFVAPLLDIVEADNFVFDLAYSTSSGKSITTMIAASAWGNPDKNKSESVVHTWRNTINWINSAAAVVKSIPLFLDDTKQAPRVNNGAHDISLVGEVIYEISGGKGKGRGTPTGIQKKQSWKTVLMSNGEQRITKYAEQHGGAATRCVSCWGSPFGAVNDRILVDKIKHLACHNYGHAADRFIRYLLNNRSQWDEWRRKYDQFVDKFSQRAGDDRAAGRISKYIAGIAFAGILAKQSMPELEFLDLNNLRQPLWESVVDGSQDSNTAKEALRDLYSYATENQSSFFNYGKSTYSKEYYGRWDEDSDKLSFTCNHLKKFISSKYEFHSIVSAWHDNGWLITNGKKKTGSEKINDKTSECYRFSVKQIESILDL